jgi:hypothetical protein
MAEMFQSYRRFSAATLLIAGSALIFGSLFRPDQTIPGAVLNDICSCVYGTLGFGFMIAIFGLIALYLTLGKGMSHVTRGAILVSAMLSGFISGALFIIYGFIIPILSEKSAYSALLLPAGPIVGGAPMFFLVSGTVIYSVAIAIIGIHLVRRPNWRLPGAFLLAAPLMAFTPPLPYLIGMIGGVFLGLGYIGVGYRLWKLETEENTARTIPIPSSRVQ